MNPVNQIGIEGDRASFVGGTPAVDGFSAYVAAGRFLTNAPFQSALGVHVLRVNPITTGVPTNGFLTYRYNGLPTTLSAPMKSPGPRSATATPAPTETGIGTYHDQSVRLYGHVDIAEVVFYADGLDDPSLLAVEKYLLMKHKIP